MKKSTVLILLALFAALMIAATLLFPKLQQGYGENTAQAEPGSSELAPAADFTICDADGNQVSLSDFAGKPVVVNFWATWCKYCVQELPYFNSLYEEYKDEVSFVMLDLNDGQRETKSAALEFAEKQGYSFPIYFDTDFSASYAYSVTGIPMTLFADKDGNLYKVHSGMMDEKTLRNYIEALIGE